MRHLRKAALDEEIRETQVIKDAAAIWHLGQEGLILKGNSQRVLVFDPYLSDSIADAAGNGQLIRNFPAPLAANRIDFANYVFITHHHEDHLDPATLAPLAKASSKAKWVVSKAHQGALLELGIQEDQFLFASPGEPILEPGLEIHAILCKHEEFEYDAAGHPFYLGYLVKFDGICFYHAGDTVLYSDLMKALQPHSIDIAYIPINGRDFFRNEQGILGNLNYREAVELAAVIQPDLLIPCHYDLFKENYENPSYFVDYLFHRLRYQKFKMMMPGEQLYYLKVHSY